MNLSKTNTVQCGYLDKSELFVVEDTVVVLGDLELSFGLDAVDGMLDFLLSFVPSCNKKGLKSIYWESSTFSK